MEDYSQGKIYKIISSECDLVYYGSTVKTLNERLRKHKLDYKRQLIEPNYYVTSFELLKQNNYEIVLVENYPCNSKKELRLRERFYIENNECVNKFIPGRTPKEYYEDNHERILNQIKQYQHNNRKRIIEYKKEYYKTNREIILEQNKKKVICEICGFEGSKCNLNRHQKSKKCLEHNNIQL